MTLVICGYKNCSYNVEGKCGSNFAAFGTKRYGHNIHPCGNFTTENVDDIVPEIYPIVREEEENV